MLNRIFNFFRSKEPVTLGQELNKGSHGDYISFWTAGTNYDNRNESVKLCRLNEVVNLVREKENRVDSNAIRVKRADVTSLGFVVRFNFLTETINWN